MRVPSDYAEWTEAQDCVDVTVDGNDLEIAYYEEGTGDPVVFLHGIPTNSFLWKDVVEGVAEERRVVVPDMAGYGQSSMYDGFDRSVRAQEAVIDALLDDLGVETFSFVGHDLGGGVGLRCAVHRPDAVEELVLSNAVAYDSWPVEPVLDLSLPSMPRGTGVEELQAMLDDMLRGSLYGDDVDEAFVEGMREPWASEEGVVSLSRAAVATNTNDTTEIDPAEVTADTLLLWGGEDEFQPIEYAERLRDDVDDAELVVLDDAYHWVPIDRSEAYAEELESFLLDG